MKSKIIIICLAMAWVAASAGCKGADQEVFIPSSGKGVTSEYDIRGFNELEISGFFQVEVIQGEQFQVMTEATEILTPYLEITKRGKTLRIGMKPGYSYNFENTTHKATVVMPKITGVNASGKSAVRIHDYADPGVLSLMVTDFSFLSGTVNVDRIDIEASGFATVRLQGSVQQAKVNAPWNSTVNLNDFTVAGG